MPSRFRSLHSQGEGEVGCFPSRRSPSVLILGLGGGTAAQRIRELRPGAHIVGVEFDQEADRLLLASLSAGDPSRQRAL